jgi:hypothetical protein
MKYTLHEKLSILIEKTDSSTCIFLIKLIGELCFNFDSEVRLFIEAGIEHRIINLL